MLNHRTGERRARVCAVCAALSVCFSSCVCSLRMHVPTSCSSRCRAKSNWLSQGPQDRYPLAATKGCRGSQAHLLSCAGQIRMLGGLVTRQGASSDSDSDHAFRSGVWTVNRASVGAAAGISAEGWETGRRRAAAEACRSLAAISPIQHLR